jgi:hypothetical protein
MATICKSHLPLLSALRSNQPHDYEPSGCNCDNKTTYDQEAINAACTEALRLASEGRTLGRDRYPHVYNGRQTHHTSRTQD